MASTQQVAKKPAELTDLYQILKEKEKHLEFLDIKEEYVKDEMKNLKRELIRAKEVSGHLSRSRLVLTTFCLRRK
jgi:26S proteasome regulatory subunit T3